MNFPFLACGLLAVASMVAAPAARAAELDGEWRFSFHTQGGDRSFAPVFRVDGEAVGGKWGAAEVKGRYANHQLELSFPYTSEEAGRSGTLQVAGTLSDGRLQGTWRFEEYQGGFDAVRAMAAAVPSASPLRGSWECRVEADRVYEVSLRLAEEAGSWKGKLVSEKGEVPLNSLKVAQDAATFAIEVDATVVTFAVKATGDRVEGTWRAGDSSGPVTGVRKSD